MVKRKHWSRGLLVQVAYSSYFFKAALRNYNHDVLGNVAFTG